MHRWINLKRQGLVILLVIVYVAVNMVLTFREIYVFNLLPVLLIVVYLTLARIDIIYFIIVLLTPVSVQLIDFIPSSAVDFAIPTEPLLFGVMIVLLFRAVYDGFFNRRLLNHPVTYAILFNLFWMLITSITSTLPLVSFKFLLARIWFVTTYYLLAVMVFRKTSNIMIFIWCFSITMLVVIVYTISRQIGFGLFNKQAAHFVMGPFFRDHTSYGAALAMLFYALGAVVLHRSTNIITRFFYWGAWLLVTTGLLLSYTRAAWISVLLSSGVLVMTFLKVRFRYILIGGILAFVYFAGQRTVIIRKMQQNRQESSASLGEHVRSISNITTDESNLERINRWNSALRMFRERPVFGWGPGTYMFKYAPFQISGEKTGISTDLGDLGNAHSEYIGPLAESGIFGSLSFILISVVSLLTGFRVYSRIRDNYLKQITLGLILGFITYLVHGTLNNFLDTDKASVLFWGFTAVFVALDLFGDEKEEQRIKSKEQRTKTGD
ncbi:MAG TPA: O-antigen ligase family protein [Bacteroidales bacterium]|nr:O-antigen ligase family protein [Bacteroidales bacterium]